MSPTILNTLLNKEPQPHWKPALPSRTASILVAGILLALAVGLLAAAAAIAAPATLYNQSKNDAGSVAQSRFTAMPADDFVVPTSVVNWHITSVFAHGTQPYFQTAVKLVIYRDSSGSPGTPVYTRIGTNWATDVGGEMTMPTDVTLTPGHYWLSVGGNRDWAWEERNAVSHHAAMTMQCGSGWIDLAACGTISGVPAPTGTRDLMFSLTGTALLPPEDGDSQGQNDNQGENQNH